LGVGQSRLGVADRLGLVKGLDWSLDSRSKGGNLTDLRWVVQTVTHSGERGGGVLPEETVIPARLVTTFLLETTSSPASTWGL